MTSNESNQTGKRSDGCNAAFPLLCDCGRRVHDGTYSYDGGAEGVLTCACGLRWLIDLNGPMRRDVLDHTSTTPWEEGTGTSDAQERLGG